MSTQKKRDAKNLPQLDPDVVRALWERAPKRHMPTFLAEKWRLRMDSNPTVEKFISDMRDEILTPELDDHETAAAYAGAFMVAFLQRFERLVQTGKMDHVLPGMSGLPILYLPRAGKRAAEWKFAEKLCAEKRVATESNLEYRGNDNQSARNATWKHLTYDTVWVIQHAALELPAFHALREKGTPRFRIFKQISKRADLAFRADVFLLENDELLVWPDWLDACDDIPRRQDSHRLVPVREASDAYATAARAVLNNFFADPDNPYADKIVAEVKGVRSHLGRHDAVAEARKNQGLRI